LKLNKRRIALVAIIGTFIYILLVNNSEYRKYRTLYEKEITVLGHNIVTLDGLQMEKIKLKTNMDNNLKVLKSENERLKASVGVKKIAYLRPHDSVDYLSLQYGTEFQPTVGYMGTIKTFDFDTDGYTQVNLLEIKGDFAKISVEAYIPKWYIVDKQKDTFNRADIMHSMISETMYTKAQCPMKVAPDSNSFTQLSLAKGKAVYVTKEYADWYFVELQHTLKDTDFTQGWVKKSQLGTISSTEALEAVIKKGTLIMEYYDSYEKEERILNYDVPVYFLKDKNIGDFNYGRATESWGFWINSKDIDFGYIPK
jgi:SH3-like domain-containing protein